MANFFQILETVLRKDTRFFSKDTNALLRNKVYESAVNMDTALIKLLLSNEETKKRFFTDVDGILIFDKVTFGWAVNNYQFLPDSYTRFKNRIGLTDSNDNLISTSNDVVLSFPYKDCVLEGGQTKEDQKRDEIFYNTILAPDEVDRLLYPKVLVNAKRYNQKGVEECNTYKEDDNLIIKGNNLLALSSLLKRYARKIKLIYADPPYNTDGDTNIFSYNNSFNHSTWLTFMKNRLELSKQLLSNDGFLVLAIDHAELFYLGVLVDEIFGRENFISIITVQHNPKGRNQAKFFSANSDFLLVYAKDKTKANFHPVVISDEVKQTFTEKDIQGSFRWVPYLRARTVWSRNERPENWYPIYVSKDLKNISSSPIPNGYELFPKTNSGDFSWKNIRNTFDELNHDGYFRAIEIDNKIIIEHKYREQQVLKNVWIDKKYQSEFNGHNLLKELIGKNDFSFPKSLYAVLDIIKITTANDDIVLDFFGGSGTTAHAVIEANKEQEYCRKFIICEQLEEHLDVINKRLKAILKNNKELTLSYVCCELAKCNQHFVDKTNAVINDKEAIALLDDLLKTGFISHRIFLKNISDAADDFAKLTLEEKKRFILDLLDKNMLFVNLCDMNDNDFLISEADKKFTKSFYNTEEK